MPAWVLAAALLFFILAIFLRNHRRAMIICRPLPAALLGGALRYQSSVQPSDNTSLQFYNNKGDVRVEGMVSNSPETKKTSIEFRLAASSITADNRTYPVTGNVLVHLPFYKQLHYGDILQLTGKLETPPKFDDFDYRNYLSNQGIYSIINYPRTEVLKADQGIKPLSWIYDLRPIYQTACRPACRNPRVHWHRQSFSE